MKTVLVVSPSFPPVSAADVHRVRTSLPFYREFGWDPIVLAVAPGAHGGLIELELLKSLPDGLRIVRTNAIPKPVARWVGVGNVALRALPHLYRAGARAIREHRVDLVYFSTTMFPALILGRAWKGRSGTPYVFDMQDPWKTDYRGAGAPRGLKARMARAMHATLEPIAMRKVDGITSVSPAYVETLRQRYPWIQESMCATIPFGVSMADFDAAAQLPWRNQYFDPADGCRHGVGVGRGGGDVATAARILFDAFRRRSEQAGQTDRVRLTLIGTSYASDPQQKSVEPVAVSAGVGDLVSEFPERVPYLESLRLLGSAHFSIILGSDDPSYSPSKIYPCLMTGRPFVAVMHEASPVVPLLRQAGTGVVETFGPGQDRGRAVSRLAESLARVIESSDMPRSIPAALAESIDARTLTGRQCALFEAALRHASPEGIPCVE